MKHRFGFHAEGPSKGQQTSLAYILQDTSLDWFLIEFEIARKDDKLYLAKMYYYLLKFCSLHG